MGYFHIVIVSLLKFQGWGIQEGNPRVPPPLYLSFSSPPPPPNFYCPHFPSPYKKKKKNHVILQHNVSICQFGVPLNSCRSIVVVLWLHNLPEYMLVKCFGESQAGHCPVIQHAFPSPEAWVKHDIMPYLVPGMRRVLVKVQDEPRHHIRLMECCTPVFIVDSPRLDGGMIYLSTATTSYSDRDCGEITLATACQSVVAWVPTHVLAWTPGTTPSVCRQCLSSYQHILCHTVLRMLPRLWPWLVRRWAWLPIVSYDQPC